VEIEEGTTRLNKLVDGIFELYELVIKIRDDYGKGGLLIMDVKFLLDRLYGVRDIFQRQVAQYLFLLISKNKAEGRDTTELSVLIKHHYTASYLTRDDYKWLSQELVE
jgi:hypothetical protein